MASGICISAQAREALAFHWYQASVMHSQTLLTTDHTSSEKDAIWTAATLLLSAAFGYLESHNPASHWPNKATESGDLHWLRLSIGKKAVWDLTNPLREDSTFERLSEDVGFWNPPLPANPILPGTFPPAFLSLFELNDLSTIDNNLFYGPASMLAQLLPEKCDHAYVIRFLTFPTDLNEPFCNLLVAKEPRALLLLCWWWTKVCVYESWWLSRRATVECQAICIYLERNYGNDPRIMELLEFPRAVLGLLEQSVPLAATRSTYISEPGLLTFI